MASVTALWHKYRDDPFFYTEVNVITLQVIFAGVILLFVVASFTVVNSGITTAVQTGISESREATSTAAIAASVVHEIQAIRLQNLVGVFSLITLATLVFGYIVARVTLAPTRNTLAAQKQFIGNVAHELRTPLSIIKTNTEIALLGSDMTAEVKQTLTSNVEELDRISEIINNLLSLSALIKPERMEFEPVDLGEVVTDVVAKFGQFAKTNGQQMTVRRTPDALVWGNETGLEQIVGNLLKNAISYTPRGGTIAVTVSHALDGNVEFLIQDSGVGISRKDLFRIFEPFYRADPSRNRSHGGSGLGLAIVSELIKLHKGRITIRSAVGRGTNISIIFPAARAHAKVGTSELFEGLNEIAVDFSS